MVQHLKKKSDIYAKVVSYKGVVYGSISAASHKTGVSGTHIRRLIRDPQNTDWTYVGDPNILEESNIVNIKKSKPIMVHNVVYRSIRNASLSTGIKRRTLGRHLESNKPEHAYVTYFDS